jgi:hypothetical protein
MIFLMKIAIKLLFIHLWSIAIKLCFIFSMNISRIFLNGSYFWSQPKMSGILDPRIPTFWNSEFLMSLQTPVSKSLLSWWRDRWLGSCMQTQGERTVELYGTCVCNVTFMYFPSTPAGDILKVILIFLFCHWMSLWLILYYWSMRRLWNKVTKRKRLQMKEKVPPLHPQIC